MFLWLRQSALARAQHCYFSMTRVTSTSLSLPIYNVLSLIPHYSYNHCSENSPGRNIDEIIDNLRDTTAIGDKGTVDNWIIADYLVFRLFEWRCPSLDLDLDRERWWRRRWRSRLWERRRRWRSRDRLRFLIIKFVVKLSVWWWCYATEAVNAVNWFYHQTECIQLHQLHSS